MIFQTNEPVTKIFNCLPGKKTNTATCSYTGHVLPGFPTRKTWVRTEDTPSIFYGRASHYDPGLMWSTAIFRGFEREYLNEFDCLITGFFINDVGRVAWILYGGGTHRCLVVDNARARDLYPTLIHSRYALEAEFAFGRDVLNNTHSHAERPIVIVAYQVEEPTPNEWMTAQRLDEYLFDNWETSHYGEPRGWIQVKKDNQAWYMINEDYQYWKPIPGCLYCKNTEFVFTEKITQYTVVPGDSLNIISTKVYGYSHPRFWEAIYNANLEQMSKGRTYLQAGWILNIPVWEEIELP